MEDLTPSKDLSPVKTFKGKGFQYLAIFLIGLTVIFRFAHLDQKIYTVDEVRGLLRISGYTAQELVDREYQGDITTAAAILNYQKPNPERGVGDAVRALAGNPEHPPLYYLLARFAAQIANSSAGARVLTAVVSLLTFPALYWLCLELFASPVVGWGAIALLAVSPYQLMLAQEARQYSLWTLAVLLSSATLLRALKESTWRNWCLYAATIALGIYTHLFFILVIIAQGVYTLLVERLRITRQGLAYLAAVVGGSALFLPWVWVVANNVSRLNETTSWIASLSPSLRDRIKTSLHNLSLLFVDLNQDASFKNPFFYLVLLLVAYALYYLCQKATWRSWLYVVLLIAVPMLALLLPDAVSGGGRSLMSRYLVPVYLGVEIAVAYLLVGQLQSLPSPSWSKRGWQAILGVVLVLGIYSSAASAQAQGWWKGSNTVNLDIAPMLNQATKPLIISDSSTVFTQSLAYLVRPETAFQLFIGRNLDDFKHKLDLEKQLQTYDQVFLYLPSKNLLELMQQDRRYQVKVKLASSKALKRQNLLYTLERS